MGAGGGAGGAGCACPLGCPLGAGVQALCGLPSVRGVFPSFCPLSRFALGALLANMALFRILKWFLAWFMGFVWVCIACVLCVSCGAFVRVWS